MKSSLANKYYVMVEEFKVQSPRQLAVSSTLSGHMEEAFCKEPAFKQYVLDHNSDQLAREICKLPIHTTSRERKNAPLPYLCIKSEVIVSTLDEWKCMVEGVKRQIIAKVLEEMQKDADAYAKERVKDLLKEAQRRLDYVS